MRRDTIIMFRFLKKSRFVFYCSGTLIQSQWLKVSESSFRVGIRRNFLMIKLPINGINSVTKWHYIGGPYIGGLQQKLDSHLFKIL